MKNRSKCSKDVNDNAGLDGKKARVLARDKKWVKIAAPVAGILFAVLALWVFSTIYGDKSSMKSAAAHAGTSDKTSPAAQVKQENGEVRIPIADLDDGAAHFYAYHAGGTGIRFFLLREAEGGVRAALDACHNCYRAKRGYRQEGNTVICNNCGMSFKYENIGIVTGGCNPIPLTRKMAGEFVVLKAKDLEAGAKFF